MLLKFTGQESQLTEIDNLVKAKQGAVFAISGNTGIGKSTLLKKVKELYPKTRASHLRRDTLWLSRSW